MVKIIRNIESVPQTDVVLTIGFFDGVHCGHRYLIDHLNQIAKEEGLASSILTFWPHPRLVLNEEYQPKLLNTNEEKLALFEKLPVDYCVQIPFTYELSNLSAFEFMSQILKDKLHVRHLVIGYDHRFGHNREEGFEDYCRYGESLGIKVTKAPGFEMYGQNVSSSFIRKKLQNGEVSEVAQLLGYPYFLKGTVCHGKMLGRSLGYPTANLTPESENKLIPLEGVYAVMVTHKGMNYLGMTCIGNRPSVESEGQISIETNIFEFEEDIYGDEITLHFLHYLRPLKKYDSLEELRAALQDDELHTRELFMCL